MELIDLEFALRGESAQGRWPCVKLSVDGHVLHQGPVDGLCTFKYSSRSQLEQKSCIIKVEYYNKSNNDTCVDSNGSIVENQCVHIESIVVNGVDVVKTNAIHNIGSYTMNLDLEKYNYFLKNNIQVSPTTSTHMFENGVWQIDLKLPLLSFLTGLQSYTEPWEQVYVNKIVEALYQQYLVCKDAENQNDFKSRTN